MNYKMRTPECLWIEQRLRECSWWNDTVVENFFFKYEGIKGERKRQSFSRVVDFRTINPWLRACQLANRGWQNGRENCQKLSK